MSRSDVPRKSRTLGEITRLLLALKQGQPKAADQLVPLIYGQLREMAGHLFRGERTDHTLQPTALVNELYLRLMDSQMPSWENREHFFGIASRSMRQILVSHARKHRTEKRGGGQPNLELDETLVYSKERSAQLEALDEALTRLEKLNPRYARIVELKFFGGLTVEQTAEVLHIGATTVKEDWKLAKAWLRRDLENTL